MADPGAESPGAVESSRPGGATEAGPLDELRSLLIGAEQDQLKTLQSRLDDPATHALEMSRVLPEALALRAGDPELTKALAASVEESLGISVRNNPRPIADALFPIMGPAIRKSIAHALSGMVESLSQALEHSLSPKALRWRLVAWRTGRPFSEVVLMNTLLYRVEQVFLIHQKSGLVLHHVAAAAVQAQDATMVSAMLTAIRDFVHDSFGGDAQDSLDTLRVGELTVWIVQGPLAVLAAVVRGSAPSELRATLEDTLETAHLQLAAEMESFEGDPEPFASLQPILEDCLRARYHEPKGATSHRGAWAVAGLALLALGAWSFFYVRDQVRWNRYLERLKAEPGIVVIASGREGGRRVLTGLRDPLAVEPISLLAGSGVEPENVEGRFQLYQALDPVLVTRRATAILNPPSTATLELNEGTLRASGLASAEWIRDGRILARMIPGVARFDDSSLADPVFTDLKSEIEVSRVFFVVGRNAFASGQTRTLAGLLDKVLALGSQAGAAGRAVRLHVIGHTDADGAPERNLPLSQARADAVRAWLQDRGAKGVEILTNGVGTDEPSVVPGTEDSKRSRRCVSFRVEVVS